MTTVDRVLTNLAAVRAARLADLQGHAARIDPGVRLARELCAAEYPDDPTAGWMGETWTTT